MPAVYGLPPLPVHRLRRGSVAPPASGELRAKLGAGRPTAEPGRDADRPYETGLPAASTMVKSDMDFWERRFDDAMSQKLRFGRPRGGRTRASSPSTAGRQHAVVGRARRALGAKLL